MAEIPTTMTPTISRSNPPSWDDVLAALRSGKYTPNEGGGMCLVPSYGLVALDGTGDVFFDAVPDECEWCPLGVIRNLAGARWRVYEGLWACDDDGETEVPDLELLATLNLTEPERLENLNPLYKDALAYLIGSDTIFRWEVISFLHDEAGYSFDDIANEIERYGWHNG